MGKPVRGVCDARAMECIALVPVIDRRGAHVLCRPARMRRHGVSVEGRSPPKAIRSDTSFALKELAGLKRGKNQSAKGLADSARWLASRAYYTNDYASQEKAALHAFQTAVGEELQLIVEGPFSKKALF